MSDFKKATAKTVASVLRTFADFVEEESKIEKLVGTEAARAVNEMLDGLLDYDFFGTEGQCDPRGDHRD